MDVRYGECMALQTSATIHCTPDLVWAVMTDWSQTAYWLGVGRLRLQDPQQPVGVGSRLSSGGSSAGLFVVRQWEPERKLALETSQLGMTASYEYCLTESDGTTRVELLADCSAANAFFRLLLPALRKLLERADRGQLKALKRLTEARVREAERKADALQEASSSHTGE